MELLAIFLVVVAGIVVGFLLTVLLAFFLIRWWLRRWVKQFTDVAVEATKGIAPFMQPLRIKLEREPNPEWEDATAVKSAAKSLKAAGFKDAGVYLIDEVPDMCIQALVQPEKNVYAVIYEQPDRGVWFEVVSRYEDGASFASTTAPATGLDRPSRSVMERFPPSIDPAEMYEDHLKNRPDKPLAPATAEEFCQAFESAYAEEMDWRFERGGFTQDEIRKNLKTLGSDCSNDQVKQVHAMQQAQVNQWLQTKLQENYRAQANLSDAKWRKVQERLFFIHDRLTRDEVSGFFRMCLDWEDDTAAQDLLEVADKLVATGTPREAFARMVEKLPTQNAVKKLGHIAHPVAADVYTRANENSFDS
jgi:hypothetical protein